MAEVVILDVGHGNAAVVRDGDRAIVIDAGPGTALLEYLAQAGITEVVAVLISHADTDHLKGLLGLLAQENISVSAVVVNSDAAKGSRQWKALLHDLEVREMAGEVEFSVDLKAGRSFQLDAESELNVIAPRASLAGIGPGGRDLNDRRITSNTISAVVRAEVGGTSILFTGDIDEVGLANLLESGVDARADALVFPHHGGNVSPNATEARNTQFATTLIEGVQPARVIFSMARTKHSNPRPEIVREIAKSDGLSIMCTQMSVNCCVDDAGLEQGHLSPTFASGRLRGQSCAGTITVTPVSISPDPLSHADFIERHAPTALCKHLQ